MALHKVTRGTVLPLASSATLCAGLFLIIMMSAATTGFAAEHPANVRPSEQALQNVISDLRARLSLSSTVVVSIVSHDALMMSVEAPTEQGDPFRLSIDASFLDTLNGEEIEAALAHELGHVWVFTHHPYLQTEELANQIAMRAVSCESLERLYEKVRQTAQSLQRNACHVALAVEATHETPSETDSSPVNDAAGH
jgi:hypothetical protein